MHGANGSERGASGSRLLALSGVAFVVLVVISIVGLGGNTPAPDATAAKISSYYVSHESRAYLASFVLAASGLFIIGFGIALALGTRPLAAVRGPFWPMLLTAGSVLAGGAWIVTAFAHFALADAAVRAVRRLRRAAGHGHLADRAGVLLYRRGTSLADSPASASARTRDGVTSAAGASLGASGN